LKKQKIELVDVTLRDGEQTKGVSFNTKEKLSIAKTLLLEVKVDRIEIASALVSEKEKKSVQKIMQWAKKQGFENKVEVLGFTDGEKSSDWIYETGCRRINLLVKGSKKHCEKQLGKKPEEHFKDAEKTIKYALGKKMKVNAYLEDWSNGIKESKDYVYKFTERLFNAGVERVLLPDTLGLLSPEKTKYYVEEIVSAFPGKLFEFHAHNDYGLATANSLAAAKAGAKALHVTINGLGERAGNASLDEVVASIADHTSLSTRVNEKMLLKSSELVEKFSGRRLGENKPISGRSFFTHAAGIHADGSKKGMLYENKLLPERFGQTREYALGKLSGKASLEMNLKKMDISLDAEQKKKVLNRIVELGEKKKKVTPEDLPFIISDILETPEDKKLVIESFDCVSAMEKEPRSTILVRFNGKKAEESETGDGGYDAFMNALRKASAKLGFKILKLLDYEVQIPPGGETDAIVETTITWKKNGSQFKTTGVDSDQLVAAIKATEKMLNIANADLENKEI